MSLAAFITNNTPQIVDEWENFARSMLASSTDMTPLALRNHIRNILAFVVADMNSAQTADEQVEKSRGKGMQLEERQPSAAETHAALRLAGGFNLNQMVSEFRALRASVIKLWKLSKGADNSKDLIDLVRFNEAVDQSLTEAISYYVEKLNDSRNLFLGILTHDMRNPLGAMLMSAELIPKIGPLVPRQSVLIGQITDSGARINEIISHLLDITRARFGSGIRMIRAEMDIGFVGRMIVEEMRVAYPQNAFAINVSGDTSGNWDKARIGQVFSNLLGNAVQYGFREMPIEVTIVGAPAVVAISVHNSGVPINPEKIGRIFDSLVRVSEDGLEDTAGQTGNLGLGLFITKEIVTSHGGTISVDSSERGGTTFTARFPRS